MSFSRKGDGCWRHLKWAGIDIIFGYQTINNFFLVCVSLLMNITEEEWQNTASPLMISTSRIMLFGHHAEYNLIRFLVIRIRTPVKRVIPWRTKLSRSYRLNKDRPSEMINIYVRANAVLVAMKFSSIQIHNRKQKIHKWILSCDAVGREMRYA